MINDRAPKTVGCEFTFRFKGKPSWHAVCHDDCEDNADGLYVELYQWDEEYGFDGDWDDFMCVHSDDCDINSEASVRKFIRKYVQEELIR